MPRIRVRAVTGAPIYQKGQVPFTFLYVPGSSAISDGAVEERFIFEQQDRIGQLMPYDAALWALQVHSDKLEKAPTKK